MKLNQRLIPPLKNNITRKGLFNWLMVGVLLVAGDVVSAQPIARSGELMEVGVARIDITPTGPIRLAGYGIRKKTESEGILQPLGAKAMAFGTDAQGPSIFITVDLLGIPANITRKLTDQLSAKIGIDAARLVICASHTHGGPELGNTLNILQYRGKTFSDSMLAVDHLIRIAEYTEQLS